MGKLISYLFVFFASIYSINSFAAVKIVECEDEAGNRSYQKSCPPGFTQLSEKKIKTGNNNDKSKSSPSNISATLYVIPDCEACDEIKEFLTNRNISYIEKNVNEDIELQKELTDLTGSLKVPTTVVGDEVLTGYSRSKFMDLLKQAGYEESKP